MIMAQEISSKSLLHTISESSSAVDLVARRGVFSRKHYGSVEILGARRHDGFSSGRFRVEDGDRDEISNSMATGTDVHLENPEFETRWYFKYFLGKLHQNYLGADTEKNLFFLSVVLTDANNHNIPQYRAILWRKTGTQKICIPYNSAKSTSVKRILSRFEIKIEKAPKEIFSSDIQKELLLLEEQEGSVNFKFGVLYANKGQVSDDEMFSNETGSDAFDNFIAILGERIPLKGWDRFSGGLDAKNNTTGTESIYTTYEGHEVMFHVSTMLPFSKENKQQVERKRHVGNDIAAIVFQETDSEDEVPTFRPSMIRSHFTHIFALVTYNKAEDSYRLRVFSAESVPLFGPPLPSPAVFKDHQEFRDFLLVKLINGEKAAFNTPVFAYKRQRTLDMLIKNLQQELHPECLKQNMINKRSISDVISEPMWNWRNKKEEARQSEFVRVGQLLKLKTIVKGDAPTSLATTSLLRREPWEPQVMMQDFAYDVICGDSWGDKLIVSTEAGTFIIEDGSNPRLIFDKSVNIKQLSVVEAHGLLLFRAEKGKEGRIYVFRLFDFEGEENEKKVKTKADCKDNKLERTKGCNLFALSRAGGCRLRMVVSIGKKLSLFTWKHNAAWSAWCTFADTETIDGFQFIKEFSASEIPHVMTLLDGEMNDNQICVGYKHQFDLINERTGETSKLFDTPKASLVSAVDIYEEDEPEILISYNHISQFKHLNGDSSSDFDLHWNGAPRSIVCAFPYIIAFTHDSVEIRLVINGNLVHTMSIPKLRMISSKCDMYFTSSNRDFLQPSPREPNKTFSPVASPTATSPGLSPSGTGIRILKIPLISLIGQMPDRGGNTPTTRIKSFLTGPLINISESPPTNLRLPRIDTEDISTEDDQSEKMKANNGCLALGRTLDSADYSDSGFSGSEFSFESVESTPLRVPRSPKLNGSAEAKRKIFGCLKSPRQHRRTLSSLAAEYGGLSPATSPLLRKRIDSNQSDVFYPSSPRSESENRDGSLSSIDSETTSDPFRSIGRSPLVSIDSTCSSLKSMSEKELREELFGKHHIHVAPNIEKLGNNQYSATVHKPNPEVRICNEKSKQLLVRPFALSLSIEEDDIDLK